MSDFNNQHPITPPPELVKQWLGEHFGTTVTGEVSAVEQHIATQAARWGSDQELEACCEWLRSAPFGLALNTSAGQLRAARRPKPPSLNSIALQMLGTIERDGRYLPEITDTIRRALEQLDD